jgi:hypothetical protein
MPGTKKNRQRIIFNIKAPIRPVVKTAKGGQSMHKKYLMVIG